MKIFILGFFLISSVALNGQSFVSSQEALTILSQNDSADRVALNDGQLAETSDEFAEKKYDVKSYYLMTTKLNAGTSVETAVRETVFEIKNGGVTDQEYDNNTIADSDLSRIKSHLTTLLTQ